MNAIVTEDASFYVVPAINSAGNGAISFEFVNFPGSCLGAREADGRIIQMGVTDGEVLDLDGASFMPVPPFSNSSDPSVMSLMNLSTLSTLNGGYLTEYPDEPLCRALSWLCGHSGTCTGDLVGVRTKDSLYHPRLAVWSYLPCSPCDISSFE